VTRDFTGQEQLTDVGLVHLNGRVYDPLVRPMISVPDPMIRVVTYENTRLCLLQNLLRSILFVRNHAFQTRILR
jgi:hypothetical protein